MKLAAVKDSIFIIAQLKVVPNFGQPVRKLTKRLRSPDRPIDGEIANSRDNPRTLWRTVNHLLHPDGNR